MSFLRANPNKVISIKELKQNQNIGKTISESEVSQQLPPEELSEDEKIQQQIQDYCKIITSQQLVLNQAQQKNLEDTVVILNPEQDQDVIEQIRKIRKFQQMETDNAITDKTIPDTQDTEHYLTPGKTDGDSSTTTPPTINEKQYESEVDKNQQSFEQTGQGYPSYVALPDNVIYFEDYKFQKEIKKRQLMLNEIELKKMGSHNGLVQKTITDTNLDYELQQNDPNITPCVNNNWIEYLIWKLLINEENVPDLTYFITIYGFGMVETLLNWFLGKLKSVKIWRWKPFGWIRYQCFAEEFQYFMQYKYNQKFCGIPLFLKDYTATNTGLSEMLKDKHKKENSKVWMLFSKVNDSMPKKFKTKLFEKLHGENQVLYSKLIQYIVTENKATTPFVTLKKLNKYYNKKSYNLPKDVFYIQGEELVKKQDNNNFQPLQNFIQTLFKIDKRYINNANQDTIINLQRQINFFRTAQQNYYPFKIDFKKFPTDILDSVFIKINTTETVSESIQEDINKVTNNKPQYAKSINKQQQYENLSAQETVSKTYQNNIKDKKINGRPGQEHLYMLNNSEKQYELFNQTQKLIGK